MFDPISLPNVLENSRPMGSVNTKVHQIDMRSLNASRVESQRIFIL